MTDSRNADWSQRDSVAGWAAPHFFGVRSVVGYFVVEYFVVEHSVAGQPVVAEIAVSGTMGHCCAL
jgi:hypothetical protein